MNDKYSLTYTDWMKALDKIFYREIGLGYDDVTDYMWHRLYEEGFPVEDAFREWEDDEEYGKYS